MNKRTFSLSLLTPVVALALAHAADAPKAGEPYTETLANTQLKIEMAPIPAGKAKVLDPAKKGATKEMSFKPFFMSKTEVTWDAFDVYAFKLDVPQSEKKGKEDDKAPAKESDAFTRPTKPYVAPDFGFGHQNYPAIGFSYKMADNFCKWLSVKTGRKYRLPTEAEWEYACRAGKPVPSGKADLDKVAWFKGNAKETTHPVAKKNPNAWGLFDMIGNVSEWCTGFDGVGCVRGGSYQEAPDKVGPNFRDKDCDDWNASDPQSPKSIWWRVDACFVGFRIVCEP